MGQAMLSAPLQSLREGYYAVPGARAASLETDLLDAMNSQEIEVLFQPQFRLADGALYGAEALARWRHPTLGMIGAGELFGVAERADCVAELSQIVFERALAVTGAWPRGLVLSLNVAPTELVALRFVERLAALVAWTSRRPSSITVEITEDVLLDDIDAAEDAVQRLKWLGFRVALDDFGAGFCNFGYLKRLPLDALKLDRTMVEGVARDGRDRAVLRGIVAMAKALDLQVIAEGIEQEEQLAVVQEEGCDVVQGFLKGEPMTPAALLGLARS